MSDRKLPDWIEGFERFLENTEPPRSYIKWTAISVIAAALQRKCHLRWGHIKFYPNLYILLVGSSALGKGTAMGPGMDLINEANIPIAANSTSLQALIRRLKKANNNLIVDETGKTEMHSSMTIFSKEFTVFLGYHNNELMSALCDWFDCDTLWEYETIARDSEKVHGVWVNMIGGTTPELIKSSMPLDAIGGGLTSRIIFVYEEKKYKDVILPFQTPEEMELYELLLWDLEKISLFKGEFKYTEGFLDHYTEWHANMSNNAPVFKDQRFSGYIGRRRGHLLKLAMIMCASRNPGEGKQDMIIEKGDLERAIKILNEAEVNMARTFSGVGKSEISSLIPEVMGWLASIGKCSRAAMMEQFINDVDDVTMQRILNTLEQLEYIEIIYGETMMIHYKGPER